MIEKPSIAPYRNTDGSCRPLSVVEQAQVIQANEQLTLTALLLLDAQSLHETLILGERQSLKAACENRMEVVQSVNERLLLSSLAAIEQQTAADSANRLQREQLAFVAHELRNPLTPIRSAVSLLSHMSPEQAVRLSAMIERNVQHMTRLIGDLTDVSRARLGKLRMERQRCNLAQIIEDAVAVVAPEIAARSQVFSSEFADQEMTVDADPVRLGQVFNNLLINASKYTPAKGMIALTVTRVGDAFLIAVTDTGIGISAAALPAIFDAFVQDAHAVEFSAAGLGIGLTVVRELVLMHGGTVRAESGGPGLGSRFEVMLPGAKGQPG